MKIEQWHTKNFKHKYVFTFKGQTYLLNSHVKLTKFGKEYLETEWDTVKLTAHFYVDYMDDREFWTFHTRYNDYPCIIPFYVSTDHPLEELIEEVIPYIPPTPEEIKKQEQKYMNVAFRDWEVPDVLAGWILVIIFFIAVEIFKDWWIKYSLRMVVGWYFGAWRQKRMIEEGKWKESPFKKNEQTEEKEEEI